MRLVKKYYPEDYKGIYFDKNHLLEKFELLITFEGLDVFDAEHTIERFKERFPHLSVDRFFETLIKGLRKIHKTENWGYEQNQYVIISRKYKIKIPLHIRPDKYNPLDLVGIVSTTLHSEENPYNKYDEIQILVEKSKKERSYQIFPEFEKQLTKKDEDYHWFNHYLEEGVYWKDFEYIEVE